MIDTITIIMLEKDASPMLLKRICINSMLKNSFEAEIDHKLSLITGIIKPSIKINEDQITLYLFLLGIKANKSIVITTKVAIECPEGKDEFPERVLPIITKLSLSNIAAGLGIANSFFNVADTTNDKIAEVNNASQSLGA